MRNVLLATAILASACATTPDDPFELGHASHLPSDGKADGPSSCGPCAGATECAWDCTSVGAACAPACAPSAAKDVFVTASVTGGVSASVDSRTTPYVPKLALDNVLIYGCELWHYADGSQGVEIELRQLVHSPFAVDANDPERYQHDLDLYVTSPRGPGSYKAEGAFAADSDAARAGNRFWTKDGCTVELAADNGGLSGTFTCALATTAGATAAMTGQFACPGAALAGPEWVAWKP